MCSFLAAQQQTKSFTTAPKIKTNSKAGGTHIADTFLLTEISNEQSLISADSRSFMKPDSNPAK